jgi:phage tail sheath protein FI
MNMGTSANDKDRFFAHLAPDVYLEETFRLPRSYVFTTGVPVFLGLMSRPSESVLREVKPVPHMLSLWAHFGRYIGSPSKDCSLAFAVRGFFENGGRRCYVAVLKDSSAESLVDGLEAISHMNTIDLVCAPDLVRKPSTAFELQQLVVNHCDTVGDRFAILDSRLGDSNDHVWEQWSQIDGKNGAIYYPWLRVHGFDGDAVLIPPCGYVAGVYARTDYARGVHKAPANESLNGVLGLERLLTSYDQAYLNPKRINCIRSFPGRGIRIWGARTLSGDDAWTYVNVRRLFLTAVRWIGWHMDPVVFEPNDAKLWARIERELTSYFLTVYRWGALKGRTPQEAFYVKCNAQTNPPEVRELGYVVTEVGLAPAVPYEFVVVRLIHGASGVSISGPVRPEQN